MRIAIEGCCHGELDQVYASVMHIQQQKKIKIDLLLICGDFQAIRNLTDLSVLACPEKYRSIGTFYKYYSGEKKAPVPTVFIGGNHEASNYLWELFHGGWVCPNIYFLGFAGVVNFGGLRIAGISGIYKKHDYENGYYEQQPFNESHARSIYHVRKFNVYRLAQIRQKVDIFLSHDWPRGIALYGNVRKLLLAKPFLAGEINTYTLGSYPSEHLLKLLKPRFWFSAHLHVKYAAMYNHGQSPIHKGLALPLNTQTQIQERGKKEDAEKDNENVRTDEVFGQSKPALDNADASEQLKRLEDDGIAGEEPEKEPPGQTSECNHGDTTNKETPLAENDKIEQGAQQTDNQNKTTPTQQEKPQKVLKKIQEIPNVTRFLALDKCLPGRDFLQVIDIDVDPPQNSDCGEPYLSYDKEWLSIVRATRDLISFTRQRTQMPPDSKIKKEIADEMEWVEENIPPQAMRIPENFVMTAPAYSPDANASDTSSKAKLSYINPQTRYFCDILKIKNFINPDGIIVTWDGRERQPGEQNQDPPKLQQDASHDEQTKSTVDVTS